MIIKESKPISMIEADSILEKKKESKEEKIKEVRRYIKKFVRIKKEDAVKIREELSKLDIIKLNDTHITKILDLVPMDAEDLRKIFANEAISLNQEEINKILNVTSKIKVKQ
ncbi:hypothetical protein CO154_01500 [Candidatus Pacearchaeota archaeon CG_4_9_14_3_um_filter_31_7]|nr:MAG: hypothetical protein AUJ10_03225 [Candidatus Pacearchaeota archaeon CG1_02_31_27]PIN92417.1 MAG: hypothetical protein COU55_01280 [Candidatus Pacearchaeota archaeon CG10_big_fil_rev_8_21_14_0_10_31_59]PIZ81002.1 MAG: hypothetical protein COX99_00980 [Candidatus Pacearchaeota archaeon CG_4_10_14_0_2_um_filter_31_10]PJA70731.1 MAG: hypothetical protein CO154_01500 [Candidatus Pacearchaeota archaeon CG_4_9_14_3_um_filter_31_7]